MHKLEGVTKYHLIHTHKLLGDTTSVAELNAWRSLLHRLGVIGQNPERYNGLGFGNISARIGTDADAFIISATQTGHLAQLRPEHYGIVERIDFNRNTVWSIGPGKPSSEALTHACVYRHAPLAQAVIHAHCPEIWRNTADLDLPHTAATIAYGTLAMVNAVETLFSSRRLASDGIFSMLGHEDGIVAFGRTIKQAAHLLIDHLTRALAIEQDFD